MSSSDSPALIQRRAVVTGAAQGLGFTLAQLLAEQGWEVWAADVRPVPDSLQVARRVVLDVASEESVDALFADVEQAGGLDGLVNNAAVFPLSPWDELEPQTWRRTIDVNLTGSFLCARAAGESMRRHGRGGSIVNLTSLTFFKGIASGADYAASKGGVVGLTRSFAKAFGPFGVRVNAVGPGLMATEGVREQARLGQFPPVMFFAVLQEGRWPPGPA
nr:SDR family oxidoreductase [Streptomyces sp. NBC_00899]